MDALIDLLADLDRRGLMRIALQLLIIVVVALLALRFSERAVRGIVGRLLDREATEGTAQELSALELEKRRGTLSALGASLLRTLIAAIALLMALQTVNIDIAPAIAGLGIVGIAVGFGAQSLVRDYIAGAFILIENHYARGDTVTVAGVTGTVEDLTLRRTTLRDMEGTVHSVPNGLIGVSSNLTRVWARLNLDVVVRDPAAVPRATEIVDRVGRELYDDPAWKRRVLEAPRVDRVKALAGTGITLKVLGVVAAAARWAAAGEMRRRIVEAFTAEGIEIGG